MLLRMGLLDALERFSTYELIWIHFNIHVQLHLIGLVVRLLALL